MNSKQSHRRQFLKDGAALAGLALGGAQLVSGQTPTPERKDVNPKDLHAYGLRSHFEKEVRVFVSPPGVANSIRTPLQDSVGTTTPNSLFFINSHDYEPPDIDPQQHRLMIHGLVEHPLIFTLEELKRLPSVSRVHFLECRANGNPATPSRRDPAATIEITHGLTACSEWTGVPLSLLLKEAGVKKGGNWIVAEGAERGMHWKSIPIEKALDDSFVAYGQNGEAVRPEQGYPLRLIVPGWQGVNNVKWLRRIKVVEQPTMAIRESSQYTELRPDGKARWFDSELGVKSVITRPSSGQRLPGRGFHEITGLAWSGAGAIRRVEVSTDGGKTWKDAQLQGTPYPKAHTRFCFPWTWNGEETVLKSRATDERGDVQPTVAELTKIWSVPADYFEKVTVIFGNFNAIQPWKVNRDGSVQNAMFA